jgi:hypothetical protein
MREKKKRSLRRTETLIMTPPVSLEDLDETNPMTSKKVINGDHSGTHEQPKDKWALTPLDFSCDPLPSPFVTFFGVVGFVLSISFLWYQWYRHCNFDVPLMSFYFYFYFSLFPLSSKITKRREERERERNKQRKKRRKWPHIHIKTSMMTPLVL